MSLNISSSDVDQLISNDTIDSESLTTNTSSIPLDNYDKTIKPTISIQQYISYLLKFDNWIQWIKNLICAIDQSLQGKTALANSNLNPAHSNILIMFRTIWYFFLWYFFTVVYNISNKRLLNDFPLPVTVSATQLLIGLPVFLPLWFIKPINYNIFDKKTLIHHSKIAFCHGFGSLATVISLGSGSVSFTHVIKALEPVVAAILSFVILKQLFPTIVYISLIPIVFGVGLASAKEISFTWIGFISAMLSNIFYQMRIVLAKKEMDSNIAIPPIDSISSIQKISPSNLFRIITILATLQLIPLALLIEGRSIQSIWNHAISSGASESLMISNLLISGVSYYMYNEVAFWLLEMIHPITHAVGNTIKRIVIILASIVILKSPVNTLGLIGAMIAITGTLAYSLVQQKYKSNTS